MPERRSKDVNQIAKGLIDQIIEITEGTARKKPEKNPSAVALGRLGGLKGGPARKEKLSPKRRKEIAKRAAKARWSKKPKR
jgi:hypothetical protein